MRAGAGIAKRLRPRPRDGVAMDPLNWSDGQREMWEEGELQLTDDALLDFEDLGHVIGARFEFRVLDALVDADQHVAVDVGSVVNVPQVLDKILQFHPLVGCNEPMAILLTSSEDYGIVVTSSAARGPRGRLAPGWHGQVALGSITRGLLNRLFPRFHHEMALGSTPSL